MGQLDPSRREISLFTKQFLEAAKLQGTAITIKLVSSISRDVYKDPSYIYNQGSKSLDVILNERPNRKVLDSYGWYNEAEEFVPMVMYVAKYGKQGEVIKPITGTIVLLPYELAEDEIHNRVYMISDAVLTNPGSWMWVCKIVPYRKEFDSPENRDEEADYDNNYNYLNIPK